MRGNLDSATENGITTNYTYNARNMLASVGQMSYTYDHNGRRVNETFTDLITPANSWTRDLLWDEFSTYGDVLAETDGSSGALHVRYVLADGQLLSQQQDGNFYYYLTDAQGSVRILADSDTGATGLTDEDTYDYDAYGDIHAQTGTTPNRYLYTGQRHDATTGDYYLRARQYDPGNGRFLSMDTWPLDHANPVELNRYVYAAGNPVMFSDPSGYSASISVSRLGKMAFVASRSLQYVSRMMSINLGRIGIVVQRASGPIVRHLFWKLSRAVADGLIDNVFYTMGKPEVSDRKLQDIVDVDYRPEGNCDDDPVGDGGTADAIQNEVDTGEPTCGRFHDKKGRDLRIRYKKWIQRQMNNYPVERRASEEDINTAIDLHNQLVDALERVDGVGKAGNRFATPYSHPPNP